MLEFCFYLEFVLFLVLHSQWQPPTDCTLLQTKYGLSYGCVHVGHKIRKMCNPRPITLHEIHMSPSTLRNLLTQGFSYRMFWLGYRPLKWQTDGDSQSPSVNARTMDPGSGLLHLCYPFIYQVCFIRVIHSPTRSVSSMLSIQLPGLFHYTAVILLI